MRARNGKPISVSDCLPSQAAFVSEPARQAGIRVNDIMAGVDDEPLFITAQQFQAYVRLHYKVGDRITYNVLRDGQRLNLPLKLVPRPRGE